MLLIGYDYCFVGAANGELAIVSIERLAWLESHGTNAERIGALVCQWLACEFHIVATSYDMVVMPMIRLTSDALTSSVALCVFILAFYAYHYWKATTGWEEGQ